MVFDDDEERPAVDVIASARRQARECINLDVATLWALAEHRALAALDRKARTELEAIFGERAKVYAERVRFKGQAR